MGRVLVAVDGHEHVGAATAYLIGLARKQAQAGLTDVTVVTVVPPPRPRAVSSLRETCAGARAPVSVEAARPWLEDAGTSFAFRKEVGDVTNIVSRLVAEDAFDEVVLVSGCDAPAKGPWQKSTRLLRRLLARFNSRRRRSRVLVVRSERRS